MLLPGLRSLALSCGTSDWSSSAVTAGLRNETLLLFLFALSAQLCSGPFKASTSLESPHCLFMASSLCFFILCLVCLHAAPVVLCTIDFLLAAVFLVDLFFPVLLPPLHPWEEEPESCEDEVKLKIDRSCCWAVMVSDWAAGDVSTGKVTSDSFSTAQRTLWLRGLNQILKFFLFKTWFSGSEGASAAEESEIIFLRNYI